jgi:hypothetical protein
MIAKRFLNDSEYPITTQASPLAMPAGLVIAPGVYTLNGVNYNCVEEGLYRFWNPLGTTTQKIVYQSNIPALMSALAWICVNGKLDEALTVTQKTNQALTSKLRMLCGKTVEWAKAICDSLSIQCRTVNSLTAATPTNYYDGHVMLEVKVAGQWVLYDLPNDFCYNNLPLKDALPLQPSTVAIALADDGYSVEPSAAFDVTAWQEMTMRTPAQKRAEIERVLQIPGVTDPDGKTYFYMPSGLPDRTAWITGLSANYFVLSQSAWLAKYYP